MNFYEKRKWQQNILYHLKILSERNIFENIKRNNANMSNENNIKEILSLKSLRFY